MSDEEIEVTALAVNVTIPEMTTSDAATSSP